MHHLVNDLFFPYWFIMSVLPCVKFPSITVSFSRLSVLVGLILMSFLGHYHIILIVMVSQEVLININVPHQNFSVLFLAI